MSTLVFDKQIVTNCAMIFLMENEQITLQKNFFKKLIDGDFGLVKTFWLYAVFIPLIAELIAMNITGNIFFASFLLVKSFQSVALIGAWNSKKKYPGSRIWIVLAEMAVVLGLLGISLKLFNLFY